LRDYVFTTDNSIYPLALLDFHNSTSLVQKWRKCLRPKSGSRAFLERAEDVWYG